MTKVVGTIPSWLVYLYPLLASLKHPCHFFPINRHKMCHDFFSPAHQRRHFVHFFSLSKQGGEMLGTVELHHSRAAAAKELCYVRGTSDIAKQIKKKVLPLVKSDHSCAVVEHTRIVEVHCTHHPGVPLCIFSFLPKYGRRRTRRRRGKWRRRRRRRRRESLPNHDRYVKLFPPSLPTSLLWLTQGVNFHKGKQERRRRRRRKKNCSSMST